MGFKADQVHECGEEGVCDRPGERKTSQARVRPSERNTAWQPCFRSCRSDSAAVNPEPGPWTVPDVQASPQDPSFILHPA